MTSVAIFEVVDNGVFAVIVVAAGTFVVTALVMDRDHKQRMIKEKEMEEFRENVTRESKEQSGG